MATPRPAIWEAIAALHRFNSLIWSEEDLARRTRAAAEEIAANKRAIDIFNQARNDTVEKCDELILLALQRRIRDDARLNSETPGQMIDRLSILALKLAAMTAQAARIDASDSHRERCRSMAARLTEQQKDLGDCFDALMADCAAGHARFKVYRQFKMYNDPSLNPSLYREDPA